VGSYERPISAETIGSLFAVDYESIPAVRRRSMHFVLAVLRDMYADDREIREWLAQTRPELGDACAADLLLRGKVEAVEACVVREWNESAP